MSGATATPPSTPVLRVKRRRSQSPAGALVLHLSAKKRKENEENLSPESPKKEAVFKFTATLDAKHDHDSLKSALDRAEKLKNDPKSLKRIVKKPQKAAEKDKADKRYKIISELRGIDAKSEEAEESERLFKLVDVVKDDPKEMEVEKAVKKVEEITCNGVPLVKLAEEEYVYDVYTMQSDAFSSTDSDNSFVGDFDKMDIVDISFLDCRDMDTENDYREDFGNDSDSNDEDHWANDYPDEDEFSSHDEDEAYYRDDDLDLDFEKKQLLDELHKRQRELLVSEIDADLAYVKRVKSEKELELVYKEALQKFNKAKELGLLSQELIDVTTEFFANALEKFPFLNEDEDEDEEY